MIQEKYKGFTVLKRVESSHTDRHIRYECQCVCGKICIVTKSELKSERRKKSCGCLPRSQFDLTGKIFNNFLVLSLDRLHQKKGVYYTCKCVCGKIVSVRSCYLSRGQTKSCGCLRGNGQNHTNPKHDLSGKVFNRLTVIKKDLFRYSRNGVYWICKCSCGNSISVRRNNLTDGGTQSCGCLRKKLFC